MKISEKWLRSFVVTDKSVQEISHLLTMQGLEVEEILPIGLSLSQVVVAEILSAEKHPNADRLRVCQVSDGSEIFTIVCGAPNARSGIKVVLAKIGAVLPNIRIKKSKIRDVESQGMLCSVSELGLAEQSEGIMELPSDAPIGKPLVEYLDLDDNILDISITPNRGDCVSVLGIAREVAAALSMKPIIFSHDLSFPFGNAHSPVLPDECLTYMLAKIMSIDPAVKTPLWITERLRRSGLRRVNFIVDVTQYVMLECGQPLHAFDAQKIQGNVVVRLATSMEAIELLNDLTLTLDEHTLVIADDLGPIALAGVMGGKRAAVSETTVDVILESAHFIPASIARTARKFRINSDAAYRFERGVDPQLPKIALARALNLIQSHQGETKTLSIIVSSPVEGQKSVAKNTILLRYAKLERLLGMSMSVKNIQQCFQALNISYEEVEGGLLATPPSYRFDLVIEEDLIEEVLRLQGCHRVSAISPRAPLSLPSHLHDASLDAERLILKTRGYDEIISYSFVDEKLQAQLYPSQKPITLMNPISQEMGVMRLGLWTGLLSTLLYNLNRQQTRVRFFEWGLCFSGDQQSKKIAGLSYGRLYPESWHNDATIAHFFDVKNDVDALLRENYRINSVFCASHHPALHPTQTAQIVDSTTQCVLGQLGVLHPRLVQSLELSYAPVLFEIDINALKKVRSYQSFEPISKFPEVRRDLAFFVPHDLLYQTLADSIQEIDKKRIKRLFVFDVYQGKHIS
ncbi:MAG: phenylalanine--tRNA ligase subunit beta [Gammaproteobacteria bacterium]|nr:phenylalanine--tRNA ligase subunit beta [Gammaproteobacteria bacterium]